MFSLSEYLYGEDETQKDWSSVSPFILNSDESQILKGAIILPMKAYEVSALINFVKTTVLPSENGTFQDFFPLISGDSDVELLTNSHMSLKFLYSNSFFSQKQLGAVSIKDLRILAESHGWTESHLALFICEIAMTAVLGDNQWMLDDDNELLSLFSEFSRSDSTMTSELIKIETLLQSAAKFAVLAGHEKTPFYELINDSNKLQPLADVFSYFGSLTGSEILRNEVSHWTTANAIERTFTSLSKRDLDILKSRLFSDRKESLEMIGERYGVTRERIRQLESVAKAKILGRFTLDPLLSELSSYIRQQIVSMRPLEELLELNPFLTDEVPSTGYAVWRVFDRLDESFEIDGDWCFVPNRLTVEEKIQKEFLSKCDDYGVVPLSEATFITVGDPEQSEMFMDKWIEEKGYATYKDYLLTENSSLVSRAAAILSIEGVALSIDEIIERVPGASSRAGLRDRLRIDDRFVRADKDAWALANWDLLEYAPIRSLIERELEKKDGIIKLDVLVSNLTGMFSVSPTSVMAYASSPPFEINQGFVRKTGNKARRHRKPEDSPRFFRRESSWIYDFRVNNEALRGVSISMPVAVASILNIKHGDVGSLSSRLGPQRYSWVSLSPQVGTIRRFLESLNAVSGDHVFLVFTDDGAFDVETKPRNVTGNLAKALTLIGREPNLKGQEALCEFAKALQLSESAHVSTIISAYKNRGDKKIYELLLEDKALLPESGLAVENEKPELDFYDVSGLI